MYISPMRKLISLRKEIHQILSNLQDKLIEQELNERKESLGQTTGERLLNWMNNEETNQ